MGRALVSLHTNALLHHPGFQEAADDAQQTFVANAPRQAGMSDWYLVTQLKNFKHGIRGQHPQDGYGPQMGLMANILPDDEAITDLVAYINTLEIQDAQAAE